jgi:hypothetical protein
MILFLLFTKHFIVDFLLQTPYQYLNKGKYGHGGGLLHACLHAVGTYLIFFMYTNTLTAFLLASIDMVIHYHIDWAKVNVNDKFGWKCNNSDKFWVLMGLDQYLHALTYLGLYYWYLQL